MVDKRQKNMVWPACDEEKNLLDARQYHAGTVAVLQDIRDQLHALPTILSELQKLNALLHSPDLSSEWMRGYLAENVKAKQQVKDAAE
jgi:hypothetical protein